MSNMKFQFYIWNQPCKHLRTHYARMPHIVRRNLVRRYIWRVWIDGFHRHNSNTHKLGRRARRTIHFNSELWNGWKEKSAAERRREGEAVAKIVRTKNQSITYVGLRVLCIRSHLWSSRCEKIEPQIIWLQIASWSCLVSKLKPHGKCIYDNEYAENTIRKRRRPFLHYYFCGARGPMCGYVATRWFCTERPSWFMRSPVNTGIACTNSWMHFDWTWAEPVTINSAITSVYRHLMIKCIRTHQQHHLPHNAWWLSFRFNKFRRETKAMRRPVVYHNWVN